jgi:hypothetical protein|tara:strand:- start:3450 stop:5180 length:1731 start_codon:yes stop_codon:yes gene_type:complete
MPKIPTFTSKGTITSQGPSVTTNLQIPLTQTVGTALQPISKYVEQEYIKEKTLEENNKVDKLIADSYKDNENGPQGFLTLSSETGKTSNPSDASNFYDQGVDKLYNYMSSAKGQNLSRFGKQIFKSKFYGSAAQLKSNALLESRKLQFKESSDIDSDFITQKTIALSQKANGSGLKEIYESIDQRLDANPFYDERPQLKKEVKQKYQQFGSVATANRLLLTQPALLKKQLADGVYNVLESKDIIELSQKADVAIKDQKFQTLTNTISLVGIGDIPPSALKDITTQTLNGKFAGDENLQNIYNSLSSSDKREFRTFVAKKAREKRNELLFEIQAQDAATKLDENQLFNEVMIEVKPETGFNQKQINGFFQQNSVALEQFTGLNTKIQNNNTNKIVAMSDADLNRNIIGLIARDKINRITDKFTLVGETESRSIVERFNEGTDVDDIRFYANIIKDQSTNPNLFQKKFSPFYSFLEQTRNLIASDSVRLIDNVTYNKTLNVFKRDMYDRYQEGLAKGLKPIELIDPTNKNYIAKDYLSYTVDKNEIFNNMMKNIKKDNNVPKRLPGESFKDYKKRTNQ